MERGDRLWLAAAALVAGVLAGAMLAGALAGIHPPSYTGTIDPARLHQTEEFGEQNLGVHRNPDGSVTLILVAARYGFIPRRITLPADTAITIRAATPDVVHGLHIPGTNINMVVVPGFISEVTGRIKKPGEYPMVCNEYCGIGHPEMWARVTVVPADEFAAGE